MLDYIKHLLNVFLPRVVYLQIKSFYYQRQKTLSQLGQDFWVFGEVFNEKNGGYFVDIGAADGIFFSNTFLLEKRYKWNGICVEADPNSYKDLCLVRSTRCFNVCVDSHDRIVDYVQGFLVGGILDAKANYDELLVEKYKNKITKMQTKTLVSILDSVNAPDIIDYLSIDVEGSEYRVLYDFPFDKYTFRCITIERPNQPLRDKLMKNGYVFIKEIPKLDVFYIHESFVETYKNNLEEYWVKNSYYYRPLL